jgi:replicative superfamily II helicase
MADSVKFATAKREVEKSRNKELKELFNWGFGIHHAGMLRSDRNLMERLFSEGLIRVNFIICIFSIE